MNYQQQLEQEIAKQLGFSAPVTQSRGKPSASTRKFYNYHEGTDYGLNAGTPIKPTFSGKVLKNYYDQTGYGARSVIQNPSTGQTYYLSHLSKYGLPEGSTFQPGQVVAYSGGLPGSWGAGNTTGQHLDVVLGSGTPNFANILSDMVGNVQKSFNGASLQSMVNKAKQLYGNKAIAVAKGAKTAQALQKKLGGKIVKITI